MNKSRQQAPNHADTSGGRLKERAHREPLQADTRAISSVLDVTVFLLLVSAAVGLFVYEMDRTSPTEQDASEIATVLTTTTETITYDPGGATEERSDHGSLAQLLATAAVLNTTVDGDPVAPTPAYRQTVESVVGHVAITTDDRVHIWAQYEPIADGHTHQDAKSGTGIRNHSGMTGDQWQSSSKNNNSTGNGTEYDRRKAALSGGVTVGHTPPPDADVDAAMITVPVQAAETVSDTSGTALVPSLFPPKRTQTALESRADERAFTTDRYRQAADTIGVDVEPALAADDARAANAILEQGIGDHLANETKYTDTSGAAPTPQHVTIVVRTWST